MDATLAESVAPQPIRIGSDILRPRPSPPETFLPSGWLHRFWFRFGALYLALYNVDVLLQLARLGDFTTERLIWRKIVPAVGQHVLRLPQPITVFPNGSGDTTFNYVHLWCLLVVSSIGALAWAFFDRERRADPRIRDGMRILLRYTLAAAMLGYGTVKLLHQQMSAPSFARLLQPYGDSSPMGLLWTFMGQSAGYSAFAGIAEIIPGVLLLFRRTALLGALISAAVMANVVAMNLCFDVPVKIYSSHLLLFALVLAAPGAPRLLDFFARQRAIAAASVKRISTRRWHRPVAIVLKVIVVAAILADPAESVARWWTESHRPKPELYGLYEITEFSRDGETVPPLLTETRRWRNLVVTDRGTLIVVRMDGSRAGYLVKIEPAAHRLVLTESGPRGAATKSPPIVLRYSQSGPGVLQLRGKIEERDLVVRAQLVDESKFLLRNRGFHWVNEYPLNR